jgi:ketosteroid isomerase-like protein
MHDAAKRWEGGRSWHPNEDAVRKGYAAFLGGDMATLNELFVDDIVWHSPGRNPLAGDSRGKEAVLADFQKAFELTGGSFTLEIHDVVDGKVTEQWPAPGDAYASDAFWDQG